MPITPVDHDPFEGAAPAPTVNVQPTQIPGTVSGPLNPVLESPVPMVPLSDEAEWARNVLRMKTLKGDRAGVQGANDLLKTDQSYQTREGQAKAAGQYAERLAEARTAGQKIIRSFAQLEHTFDNADNKLLADATGPYNTEKYEKGYLSSVGGPDIFSAPGMTPPQAAAAAKDSFLGGLRPVRYLGNPDAWPLQRTLHHDAEGITGAVLANAGKSMNMSDARQKNFEGLMHDFMAVQGRDAQKLILDHAKAMIVNDFGLTPEEADKIVAEERARLSKPGNGKNTQTSPTHAGQLGAGAVVQTKNGPMRKGADGLWYPAIGQQ